jgi:hypothetical protein
MMSIIPNENSSWNVKYGDNAGRFGMKLRMISANIALSIIAIISTVRA